MYVERIVMVVLLLWTVHPTPTSAIRIYLPNVWLILENMHAV
jgi:hypothetical protein